MGAKLSEALGVKLSEVMRARQRDEIEAVKGDNER